MLSRVRGSTLGGLAVLAALGTATLSVAQTPENPVADSFGEEIDVRIVNLEAVVVDADGNRVRGLGAKDFRLTIDGRPVTIDYFAEVHDGGLVATSEDRGDSNPSRGSDVLVFFDGLLGQAGDLETQARAVSEQLDHLGERDRMALVFYDGHRIHEISPWTSSRGQLRQTLAGFRPSASSGAVERLENAAYEAGEEVRREYAAESVGPEGQEAAALAEAPELQMRKKRLEARLDRVARAAAAAMQRYGGGEGRQALLLVGGGWPYNSVQFFRDPRWGDPPDNSRALESLVHIADAANHLGFVLYPVDVPGRNIPGRKEYQLHAALDFLAEETGGRALKNRQALGALGRVVEDSRDYYWLGFTAEQGQADARRRVRLEVLRSDLEVRSPRHLIDRTRSSEMSARVAVASLMAADDEPILDLELGSPRRHGLRLHLPVRLTLPLDAILLLPGGEGYTADLELRISAIDENGFLSRIPVIPWRFSGPAPTAGQTVSYETILELRRLGHTVVVGVYDRSSGALLTGEERFRM